MIGIVLWGDPTDGKAVFWCEDHGDLAYFNAEFGEAGNTSAFTAGDMVQFDIFCDAEFRRAVNPSVIQENACDGLDRSLRSSSQPPASSATSHNGGQVVPFRPRCVDEHSPDLRRKQQ